MSYPKLIIQIDCDGDYVISQHYNVPRYSTDVFYSSLDIYINKFCKNNLKSTLFLVGNDVREKGYRECIANAIRFGHEIANHSYSHSSNFSQLHLSDFRNEVIQTNNLIEMTYGVKCKGFRAPNFDFNNIFVKVLEEEGFLYDCSSISTPYKFILRMLKGAKGSGYMRQLSNIDKEGHISKNGKNIVIDDFVKISVSTFPYLRFPCHFSYLLAMPPELSEKAMNALIKWHIRHNVPLVYIFHLADIVDNAYLYGTELKYYKNVEKRLDLLDKFINQVRDSFESCTTLQYCNWLKNNEK